LFGQVGRSSFHLVRCSEHSFDSRTPSDHENPDEQVYDILPQCLNRKRTIKPRTLSPYDVDQPLDSPEPRASVSQQQVATKRRSNKNRFPSRSINKYSIHGLTTSTSQKQFVRCIHNPGPIASTDPINSSFFMKSKSK
jgi:hypothetical protein